MAISSLLTFILPEGEKELQEVLNTTRPDSAGKNTPKNMSMVHLSPVEEEEEDLRPGEVSLQRQQQKKKELHSEALLLLEQYNKQMVMALIRCTRRTLEAIKRRVASPSAIVYGDSAEDKKKLDHRPAIKVKLILAVPHVGLKPALDEIQACLTTTVQNVLNVHKCVIQWGQKRSAPEPYLLHGGPSGSLMAQSSVLATQSGVLGAASGVLGAPSGVLAAQSGVLSAASGVLHATSFINSKKQELKNYYKAVSDHKEIIKLVAIMNTTISSAKVLVTQSLEHFKVYEHLWITDRDKYMTEFMEKEPDLSEFEAELKEYTAMDDVIAEEEDLLICGSLALQTGQDKIQWIGITTS